MVTKWFGVTLFAPLPFTAIAHPNPTMFGDILSQLFDCAGRVFTEREAASLSVAVAALFEGRESTELLRR